MFVPRGIDVATTDKSVCIDPIERGKSRSGEIESNKLTRRHKEETMSYSGGVNVPSHNPVGIVVSKQNCSYRPVRIDWESQRAIAVAEIPMWGDPIGIYVVTGGLI